MWDEGFACGIIGNMRSVDHAVDRVIGIASGDFTSRLKLNPDIVPASPAVGQVTWLQALRQLGDRMETMKVVLDTGAVVGGLANAMDETLGRRGVLAARGVSV